MHFWYLTDVEIEALRLSLWVSGWAVAASLPMGILAAWVLARRRFKRNDNGFVKPAVLPEGPPVPSGVLRESFWKPCKKKLAFPIKAAIIISINSALPSFCRAVFF